MDRWPEQARNLAMSRTMKAAWGSLVVSILALGLKLGAWWLTGSVALYSDSLETIINVFAACAALVALRISAKPPDAEHPYGHQKAEYFSAVLEGMMVLGAAGAILHEVYAAWQHLEPLRAPFEGILVNGAASILNGIWATLLIRWGRAWRSPAILAGGKHVMTDVWTSAGVLAGFALVPVTGWQWLDPALAAVVAVNIIWTGYSMVQDSVGALMDKAVHPTVLDGLRRVIAANAEGALEVHDIRTRSSGHTTFIEFHLVVPGKMTVDEAHVVCDRLELALREEVGDAFISIHVEPAHKAKQHGVLVL
jgi:cation diffusion facilitator family transporter